MPVHLRCLVTLPLPLPLALLLGAAPGRAAAPDLIRQNQAAFAQQSAEFRVRDVTLAAAKVRAFDKVEAAFALEATFTNPFGPDDIDVQAEITRPDGSVARVPAFYSIPYRSRDGKTRLQSAVAYDRTGEPRWMARYAPTVPGAYSLRIVARKPAEGKTATSEAVRFEAAASDHPGFVQTSGRNPLYFEHSADGSLFYPTGANVAWTRGREGPDPTYEHYFGSAGGNQSATRVWLCHWAWLEWTPMGGQPAENSWMGYAGLNYYNQMIAAAMDRVFELAEPHRLRIMLTLDDNNEHGAEARGGWEGNPYNAANGGPCRETKEVFTQAEARRAYRNRLRYILARWGYSPSLWALNSWNDCTNPSPEVVAWVKEMRGHVHALMDGVRPIQFGTNYRYGAQAVSDYAQAEAGSTYPGKPNVIQEVYFTDDTKWFLDTLKFELWSNLARGRAGVMVWPWYLVDRLNAWSPVFKNVLSFVDDVPLHRKPFQSVPARVLAAAGGAGSIEKVISLRDYGDVPRWAVRAPRDRFAVDARVPNQFLEGCTLKLYGERWSQWRTQPTFDIDLPGDGSLILEVDRVWGPLRLCVRDGEQVIHERAFATPGDQSPGGAERYVRVPLARGKHAVQLSVEGPGSQWVDVRRFYFTYAETERRRIPEVYALSSGDEAIAYVWNPSYGEVYGKVLGGKPAPLTTVEVEIPGLRAGAYQVEVWDTDTGEVVARETAAARDGAVRVRLGELRRDRAIKLRKALSPTGLPAG